MNDATLPWTVSDLILFFKQQKIKDLHFFLNWYRYLCCELVKLNFDGTVPFYPLPQKSPAPRQWQPKLKEWQASCVAPLYRYAVLLTRFCTCQPDSDQEFFLRPWNGILCCRRWMASARLRSRIPHLKVQIKLVKCFTNIVRIRTVFNIYVSGSEQKSEIYIWFSDYLFQFFPLAIAELSTQLVLYKTN